MPPAIGAAIVTALITTAVTTVISIGIGFIIKAVTPKPKPKAPKPPDQTSLTETARGRTIMVRNSSEPHRIIYGEIPVSGPMEMIGSTGATNEYIHFLVLLAGHEVEAIGDVWLDDTLSTDARFTGLVRVNKHLGADDQTADTDLMAEVAIWTTAHRVRGIAYIYVRLKWDENVWLNGLPNVKAMVKGRKPYDPRTGLSVYSNNPTLCQRDYLRASFGIGAALAEVDDTLASAAANIDDEDVALAAGGTQKRYTCDGCFSLAERPLDVMEDLLTASAGSMVYRQGKYRFYSGAYDAPTVTLDEDDLRGPVEVLTKPSRREVFNAVRGTFVDSANYYQPTDFPPITNGAYAIEDGETLYGDIELPYTINGIRAQRLAKLALERARQSAIIRFPAKLTAMGLAAWDTVYVTVAQLGYLNKACRVLGWNLSEDGGIDLTLQEETAAVYAWNAEEIIPATPASITLPTAADRPATISSQDLSSGAFSQVLEEYDATTTDVEVADDDAWYYSWAISKTITTTGGSVEIQATSRVLHTDGSSTGNLNIVAEIRRTFVTALPPSQDLVCAPEAWVWTNNMKTDTPAAGSYTYYLRLGFMKATGSGDAIASITEKQLILRELKH